MRYVVIGLSLINGLWMLVDGIYVLLNGKYIGPEKPGPWSNLFYKLKIDVFNLGPLFIAFGLLWLFWLYCLLTNHNWTYVLGIVTSVLTLWYLPLGTFFSVIVILVLFFAKQKLGLND